MGPLELNLISMEIIINNGNKNSKAEPDTTMSKALFANGILYLLIAGMDKI